MLTKLTLRKPEENPHPHLHKNLVFFLFLKNQLWKYLGPSINGLVTDGNTKLCRRGFILAPFQSTTANKIDSEHTQDYKKLQPVCEAKILRVTVKRIEVLSSFYIDF